MQRKLSGFTLVELAIVMTIIGLLIGGILKGQELLTNARLTATISQIKSYQAALVTFEDIYYAMPGDMSNAASRIPGCTIACNMDPGSVATGGAFGKPDDGLIGHTPWQMWTAQSFTLSPTAAQSGPNNETQMFWVILLKANLISGVSDIGLKTSTPPTWGVTNPAAKIGGGFLVGQGNGMRPAGQSVGTGPAGLIIGIASVFQAPAAPPVTGLAATIPGGNVLTPARAAQIDRKLDDGGANTGSVQAFGPEGTSASTGCFSTTALRATYSEANSATDCGIIMTMKN